MISLREYLFSLCCTALFCGVVCELLRSSSIHALARWICGLVMLLTLLRPAGNLAGWDWESQFSLSEFRGEAQVDRGSEDGKNALRRYISNQTSSYIEDIAQSMGIDARVEVSLSQDPMPVPAGVRIYGQTAPYLQLCLEEWIQENLNIPKEHLVWIG